MRIAVITGASSGIGKEFAHQIPGCYRHLDELWLIARSRERLCQIKDKLEREFSIRVRVFDGDLQKAEIYDRIKTVLGIEQPDIRMLVNGAGFGKAGSVSEIGSQIQEEMVELNCKALLKLTCLCLPYLSKGSRVLNIASAAAFAPQPGFAVYAATKSFVLHFSEGLAMELEQKGIIVTAVCPGPVDTAFFEVSGDSESKAKKAVMAQPEKVVKKALADSRRKKELSIYGTAMKGAKIAVKLLPDCLIRKIMKKI